MWFTGDVCWGIEVMDGLLFLCTVCWVLEVSVLWGGRSCECIVMGCFVSCCDFEVVFVLCVSWASEMVGWLEVWVESLWVLCG